MSNCPVAIISDANVLIDYILVERTLVLRLVSEHLFQIKIPRYIFNEVNQLTEDQAEALGMEIIEETMEQLKKGILRGGGLSQEDKICFAIAQENQWAIWTSDKPLHTQCKAHDIPVYWGLQLMLELCKIQKLDSAYALETAQKIEQVNERISKKIINEFRSKIKKVVL